MNDLKIAATPAFSRGRSVTHALSKESGRPHIPDVKLYIFGTRNAAMYSPGKRSGRSVMRACERLPFDTDTVDRLKTALEMAWESLSPQQKDMTTKSHIAERILRLAAQGERDAQRLQAKAVRFHTSAGE